MGLRILSWKPTSLMADTEARGNGQQAALSVFHQIQNDIRLLNEPVRKFFRAGFFRLNRPFPLQGVLFERFKGCLHFFQPVSREVRIFLCLIDDIAPVLAFIFINEVIFVISGPFIKVPLVFERLRFPAFFAAQFIALAPGKEDFPAGFAFPDIQAPVGKPIQIIDNQRMEGYISGNTFSPSLIVGIPEVEPGIFGWH